MNSWSLDLIDSQQFLPCWTFHLMHFLILKIFSSLGLYDAILEFSFYLMIIF